MKTVLRKSLVPCLLFLFFYAVSGIAQTCNTTNIEATTPTTRFTDNGDGTVTDKTTGLMWKKCSEGQTGADCTGDAAIASSWQGALKRAQDVNSGDEGFAAGHNDWRVPNIKELQSIVEEQCYDPAINLSVFPNTPSGWCWSSSPYAGDGNGAWVVGFDGGGDGWYVKGFNGYVRLVRSGQ